MAFDPFSASIRVVFQEYFVDIDQGYVAYGHSRDYTVERLAHFGTRSTWPDYASLFRFAEELLDFVRSGVFDFEK